MERKNRHDSVGGREPQVRHNRAGIGNEVEMREHHASRDACSSGRVDDRRRDRCRWCGGPVVCRRMSLRLPEGRLRRGPVYATTRTWRETRTRLRPLEAPRVWSFVHHARSRSAVTHDRRQTVVLPPGRKRHRNSPRFEDAEVGRTELYRVLHRQEDAVVTRDTTVLKQAGNAVRLTVEMGVGNRTSGVHDRNSIRVLLGGPFEQLWQQHHFVGANANRSTFSANTRFSRRMVRSGKVCILKQSRLSLRTSRRQIHAQALQCRPKLARIDPHKVRQTRPLLKGCSCSAGFVSGCSKHASRWPGTGGS